MDKQYRRIVPLRREWMLAVFEELYYTTNDQKMADKMKVDYQEGIEKSHADSAAWSRDSYMKDPEKSRARSRKSYMKDPEKSRADSAAWSRESYKNDLEKSRHDRLHKAVRVTWRTLRNVMHKTAKVTWRVRKRVMLTLQHEAAKVNKKDLEKSRRNETGLAVSYKSKKTAAA